MSTWSAWYTNQFRVRRLPTAQSLPRTDTTTERAAAAMANTNEPNAALMNLADLQLAGPEAAAAARKKSDTLFGPNIGIVSGGPAWTEALRGKKQVADELTVDVVKGWIAKSKEASQPTTTLQALVNLKRPTLRLSPLKISEEDESTHQQHGLEFEYDCDAPKCGIYVHAVLSQNHPEALGKDAPSSVLVYETVTDGGFAKKLSLDDGATLELGRFEPRPPTADEAAATSPSGPAESAAAPPTRPPAGGPDRRSKRFSFHLRRRTARAAAGPALAVVDAEAPPPPADEDGASAKEGGSKDARDGEHDGGVRVTIRLAALDEAGGEMASPNEQVTYLHVVRFGAPPLAVEGAAPEEDARPWVVKVVKREAVIGPHVFHLHEIYGLSAHSSHPVAPTSPTPASYPPSAAPPPAQEDEPSSECLLCLSSPREVVLLPCRHLVACKECALNMIEFGAGGTIQQSEDAPADGSPAVDASGESTVATAGQADEAAATAAAAAAPTPTPRRKRKAKGWFCPVCRQPYTSMLRITTVPPTEEPPATKSEGAEAPAPAEEATVSPLGGIGRPGFLRGLSLGSRNAAAASAPADVERGA